MTDLETHEILHLLSRPATGPGQVSRRRFLQGSLAAGTIASLPGWFDSMAMAATPVGPTEGILVLLHLAGGNDGLNTVVPDSSAYRSLRGNLAVANPLPLAAGVGLHPSLPKLKARFDAGKVAIVQGVGQSTVSDLSHFSSIASWMAGSNTSTRTSGWLGRWLDGVPESEAGLRSVTMGSSVPLHLTGAKSVTTALAVKGGLFGSDRADPAFVSAYDALVAMGSGPTGKGAMADRLAAAEKSSIQLAQDLNPLYTPALPDDSLASKLTLVARLVNADLGIRVFNVTLGSFDTHEGQNWQHPDLLADLDDGIAAFYAALSATWTDRVTLASFSEFGRRPQANASSGTDHGTSSVLFVIGDHVKGGLYGQMPDLTKLDSRGNPAVHVDYRSVYTSILGPWLAADPSAIIGGTWPDLGLFRSGPSSPVTPPPPPPPPPNAWNPFTTPSDLVRQQYLDFYSRVGDESGVTYWTNKLTSGARTISGVIESFLRSNEFGRTIAPIARLALVAAGTAPAFDDLMDWAARVKSGTAFSAIATEICATPAFTARFGSNNNGTFVDKACRETLGRSPSSAEAADLTARLNAGTLSRPALMTDLVNRAESVRYFAARVDVLMTYAGLLRRAPDASGWAYWVGKVQSGTSIRLLIAQFFTSAEYRRRFTG